ncbi:MAG: hypothetical protein MUF80_08415 [Burkholderiales bacterium]|nr:hypothetical protein [Burkholderiales bacterium]
MNLIRSVGVLACALSLSLLSAAPALAQKDPWAESYRLEALGKYADAQAALEPLWARQPNHEFMVIRSAWLSYLQGRHAEAEKGYLRAYELNPRSLEALLGVMLPQMAQYRWVEAITAGRKVLDESRWNYTAHVRIMICEEAMSRWSDLARHAAEVSARRVAQYSQGQEPIQPGAGAHSRAYRGDQVHQEQSMRRITCAELSSSRFLPFS